MNTPDIEKHALAAELYAKYGSQAEVARKMNLSRERVRVMIKNFLDTDKRYQKIKEGVDEWNQKVALYLEKQSPKNRKRVYSCGHTRPERGCPTCVVRLRSWLGLRNENNPVGLIFSDAEWDANLKLYLEGLSENNKKRIHRCGHVTPERSCVTCNMRLRTWTSIRTASKVEFPNDEEWNKTVKLYQESLSENNRKRMHRCGHTAPDRQCPVCNVRLRGWLNRRQRMQEEAAPVLID